MCNPLKSEGGKTVEHYCLDYIFVLNNKYMKDLQLQLAASLELPSRPADLLPDKHHPSDHFSLVYELLLNKTKSYQSMFPEEELEIHRPSPTKISDSKSHFPRPEKLLNSRYLEIEKQEVPKLVQKDDVFYFGENGIQVESEDIFDTSIKALAVQSNRNLQ